MTHPGPSPINDWQIWQIVDSAFPTGGFAHSNGLEAAWQGGWIASADDLCAFARAQVRQAFSAGAPFVAHAHRLPGEFDRADRTCDALLSNHVANRASRVQGAALLATAAHAFRLPAIVELRAAARRGNWPGHLAPCFGAVCAAVGLDARAAVNLYLFSVLRGLLSAAVRLGITGSLDAQRLQHALAGELQQLADTPPPSIDAAAQVSPILEMIQGTHDRLYSRLFVS